MLTLISFLFAIALLVTVHEYGHYWMAKRCGVRVLTFSIGFGTPLWQKQYGETRWQIAAIPLGGYVSMLGESDDEPLSPADMPRAFNRQSALRKMAIVVAGPLANLLFAWLLFALALLIGIDTLKPLVGSVRIGSVAERAGIRSGDEIIRLGNMEIMDWDDLRLAALAQIGSELDLATRSPEGGERESRLNLGGVEVDAAVLARIGLSPVPLRNQIADVEVGSVAARAGLRAGDSIQFVDDAPVKSWEQLQSLLASKPGREVVLGVRRDTGSFELRLTPQAVKTEQGEIGRIGIAPQLDEARYEAARFTLRLGPLDSMAKAWKKSWVMSKMTLQMMVRMLSGDLSSRNVSGPIGIASLAGKSADLGVAAYLQFLALVSLSLGILNLLPVPVLDGGHLLYHSAELVRGRPLPMSWLRFGQRIGIVLLVMLMLLAFYNDFSLFIFR